MPRIPYSFPLRSRRAIVEFLTNPKRRRWYHHTLYPLCWNIKVYRYDETGWNNGDPNEPVSAAYDTAWTAHLTATANCRTGETFQDRYFAWACDDVLRHYFEGYYTIYPGDPADCTFTVEGRSGGWLCLTQWQGKTISGGYSDDFTQWLEELPYETLRGFYRLIVQLDHDLQPEAEISHQFNFRRTLWEEEHREEQAKHYPEAVPANFTAGMFI